MSNQDKNDLIDLLVELDGRVKYHFVDGDSIQYCNDRLTPLLLVSLKDKSVENNTVTWEYNFLERNEQYLFTHLLTDDEEQIQLTA